MEKSLSHKMCYTPGIFDNIFRWHFSSSGNRYFNDISWAQAYTNNTLLLAAIKYLKDKEHRFGKIKGKGVIFLNCPYIQCKQSVLPRSLELRGDFQTHR